MRIFVTTCEMQPLAFFDFAKILEEISQQGDWTPSLPARATHLMQSREHSKYNYELESSLNVSDDELKHQLALIRKSRSWRLTAPYRWLGSLLGETKGGAEAPGSQRKSVTEILSI